MLSTLIRKYLTFTFTVFYLTLPTYLHADNTYQFYAGGSYTYYDYDHDSEGEQLTVRLGGYFTPVILDGKTPYTEASFWQRHSSIFVSAWKFRSWDMNQVRGASVLTQADGSGQALDVRLATPDFPLWLNYELLYINDYTYQFRSGGGVFESSTKEHDLHKINLGFYVNDHISINAGYYEKMNVKTYRMAFDSLFPMDGEISIGLDFWFERSKDDRLDATIVNSNVTNLDIVSREIEELLLTAKFYPSNALGLFLSFYRYDDIDSENRKISLSASYFINPKASINLNLSKRMQEEGYPSWPEYNAATLGFAYRF